LTRREPEALLLPHTATNSIPTIRYTSLALLINLSPFQPDNTPEPDNKPSLVKVGSPKVTNSNKAHENGNNVKNISNREEETYTAKDDAKITTMKDEKKTRDIKEAVGKESESQLKNHYRLHLGPNAREEQKKQEERIAKAEKNKAEGLAKQAEGQGKQADGGGGGDDGGKKNSGGGGDGGQKKVGDGGCADGGGDKNKGKEKAKAKAQEVCLLVPRDKLVL
jgi:hypothetical protein